MIDLNWWLPNILILSLLISSAIPGTKPSRQHSMMRMAARASPESSLGLNSCSSLRTKRRQAGTAHSNSNSRCRLALAPSAFGRACFQGNAAVCTHQEADNHQDGSQVIIARMHTQFAGSKREAVAMRRGFVYHQAVITSNHRLLTHRQPADQQWLPPQACRLQVDHATAAHGGGGCHRQVSNLKYHGSSWGHGNDLTVG